MANEESGIGLAADLEDCGNLLEAVVLLPEPRIGVEAFLYLAKLVRREFTVQIRGKKFKFLVFHFPLNSVDQGHRPGAGAPDESGDWTVPSGTSHDSEISR